MRDYRLVEIFEKYKIYKERLQADYWQKNEIALEQQKLLFSYQQHVNFVESILNNINQQEAEIIKGVYLEQKSWMDFNYSYSSFYGKLRKAKGNFIKHWN